MRLVYKVVEHCWNQQEDLISLLFHNNSAIPLYHSEIAPPDIRGRLISFFSLMVFFGQIVGYFVTFGTSYLTTDWSWRAPWLLQLLVCAIFAVSVVPFPYSPRWLIDTKVVTRKRCKVSCFCANCQPTIQLFATSTKRSAPNSSLNVPSASVHTQNCLPLVTASDLPLLPSSAWPQP